MSLARKDVGVRAFPQTVVWRWDSTPFGDSVPNEDPDGDQQGFTLNLRFPGQYFDEESGLNYNYFRDYDSWTGRYVESDPIGLPGGLNSYSYSLLNPEKYFDSAGLRVQIVCRWVDNILAKALGYQHCFVTVTCLEEGWAHIYSLFAQHSWKSLLPHKGYKSADSGIDDAYSPDVQSRTTVTPKICPNGTCEFEKAIVDRFNSFPEGLVPYSALQGHNSNSFATDLATGTRFAGNLPPGVPGPSIAPGIGLIHPSFPDP